MAELPQAPRSVLHTWVTRNRAGPKGPMFLLGTAHLMSQSEGPSGLIQVCGTFMGWVAKPRPSIKIGAMAVIAFQYKGKNKGRIGGTS